MHRLPAQLQSDNPSGRVPANKGGTRNEVRPGRVDCRDSRGSARTSLRPAGKRRAARRTEIYGSDHLILAESLNILGMVLQGRGATRMRRRFSGGRRTSGENGWAPITLSWRSRRHPATASPRRARFSNRWRPRSAAPNATTWVGYSGMNVTPSFVRQASTMPSWTATPPMKTTPS